MTAYADVDLERQRAKLDLTYRSLLRHTTDPATLRSIRSAETAWEAYRNAYLRAAYPLPNKQEAYGTSYPMEVAALEVELINRQIAALNALADLYKPK